MSVVVFDTETTDRKDGEIIEAAWLRLKDGGDIFGSDPQIICRPLAIAEHFCQRYRPEKPTTMGALSVHHILPFELEDCPSSSSFTLPADTGYIVGHSVDFDWKAAGSPANIKRICTCAMAEHLWPDADSHGQVALIYKLFGTTAETRERVKGAHGALADVHLNLALLGKILETKVDIETWGDLWAFSEDCRIPLAMPFGDQRGTALTEIDDGLLNWCLGKSFVHEQYPYLVIGIRRELARRYPPVTRPSGEEDEEDAPELEDEIW